MCPVPGPRSRALCGVRGGMRKPSPAWRVSVGRPRMAISTVPATMYPTSSPGWVCQPDSTPTGISVSTCTISRPGMDDGLCWISVRFSVLASASCGCCGLGTGCVTKISLSEGRPAAGGWRVAQPFRKLTLQEGQQVSVELVLMGVHQAVRRARVVDFLRALNKPGRFMGRVLDGDDLVIFAVQDQRR